MRWATTLYDYAFGWANPETDYEAKVLGQVDRAIALAPRNPWNYSTKSVYLTLTGHPNEGLRVADEALAINPNYAAEYAYRSIAELRLHRFAEAKAGLQQAMRLSPRDPRMGPWHDWTAEAELGLGHFDAAIEEVNKAIDSGYKMWPSVHLAIARALKGDIDEAKTALAEARRLNRKLSVKSLMEGISCRRGSTRCARRGCRRNERDPPPRRDHGDRRRRLLASDG
jgi:tetratricopeptide (TPR) repeat protein